MADTDFAYPELLSIGGEEWHSFWEEYYTGSGKYFVEGIRMDIYASPMAWVLMRMADERDYLVTLDRQLDGLYHVMGHCAKQGQLNTGSRRAVHKKDYADINHAIQGYVQVMNRKRFKKKAYIPIMHHAYDPEIYIGITKMVDVHPAQVNQVMRNIHDYQGMDLDRLISLELE